MDEHGISGLEAGLRLNETRSLPFDLNSGACFTLDKLHEHPLRADYFGTNVKVAQGLKGDRNPFLIPVTPLKKK